MHFSIRPRYTFSRRTSTTLVRPPRIVRVLTRRALAESAAGSAVALLERADGMLAASGDEAGRAEVLEPLPYTLAESGQFERAFRLAHTLDGAGAGLDVARRVAVRVRLAWVARLIRPSAAHRRLGRAGLNWPRCLRLTRTRRAA